ncbi:Serine/threonine protein kinase [Pseudobacteriovorax antillogorgiicola]|uniref:Serine/threonine protein kinase n=1 Tax=Pseudobacteriovorax antillogorgiicola TaxID=1513793 RepID=A0A1Y6CDL9_9BACT|nr:serine/threonine protein kinase [Pseudobacteriovorax antillogorgiicola]SMF49666.1 Serine/threonine protein kinase [Pseudobacteriovorax antillogorgiicola]
MQEKIGEGALGEVFRALNTLDSSQVAIKKLHARLENDPKFIGILQHEMLVASKLDHPNLLKMLDFKAEPPHVYFVTKFVDGWPLKGLLKKVGRIPPLVALAIVYEVLKALDYLHLRDMIHADLSSGNILLNRDGSLVISDYGLVSDLATDRFKYELVGTPGYYSPEHVTSQAIGPYSDLYVVGLHLIEMINGVKPILLGRSRDHATEIFKLMNQYQPSLKCDSRTLSDALQQLLHGCLQIKPQNRWPQAEHIAEIIVKILKIFGINNPVLAIRQYLYDCRFTSMCIEYEQPIYTGNVPYSVEDLTLLSNSI